MMHPAYAGLFDYDALKNRSNAHYDEQDAALRDDQGYGGYNNTMNLMANQQNKMSPWAPYFQSLQDQGVNKLRQDPARGHGIADDPAWAQMGDIGNLSGVGDQIAAQPLMRSTNLAAPALAGLRKAGRR